MHSEQAQRCGKHPTAGRLLALLAIVLVVLAAASISHDFTGVLCLAPALVLATVLFTRGYPGERLLLSRVAQPTKRWPRPDSGLKVGKSTFSVFARGGQLIARALAVRPPPRVPAAAS